MDAHHMTAAAIIKGRIDEILATSEKDHVVVIPLDEFNIPSKFPITVLHTVTRLLSEQGVKAEVRGDMYHVGL